MSDYTDSALLEIKAELKKTRETLQLDLINELSKMNGLLEEILKI